MNNRSSSPRLTLSGTESGNANVANRGSPSLRNATLGSLNRSGSPATSTGSGSGGSTLAPWANLKAGTASSSASKSLGSGRSPYANPDFPTAAEAAAVKKAQEEKEKAEAAEAAARHEQHLRSLDRFRGQALGSGKHWDEMEDEDGGFLDEVVQFADGTQYKVQASKKESEGIAEGNVAASQQTGSPVTKEERFRDVDHDRSWPLRGGPTSSQLGSQSATTASAAAPPQPLARRTTTRETLDITSGAASISLDAQHAYDPRGGAGGSRTDRGWGARGGRGDRDEAAYGGGVSRGAKAAADPSTSAVRAWGPLAVRQQSLNPEAARAQAAAAAAAPPAATSPVTAPAVPAALPRSPVAPPAVTSPVLARREPQADGDSAKATTPSVGHAGRALPPHLALRQGQMQSQQPQPSPGALQANRSISATLDDLKAPETKPQQQPSTNTSPWQTSASAGRPPAQSEPSPAASSSAIQTVDPTADDKGEMLSAAERARRRRQEEEDQRTAQRERAKQKALAIEEKMRKEAEQKAAEAEQKRLQQEAERERQRAKLQEEEENRRAEAERKQRLEAEQAAAVAKRADSIWRPRDNRSAEIASSAPLANDRTSHHGQETQSQPQQIQTSPLLSPSDGATSWRRQGPAAPAAAAPLQRGQSRQQEPSSPTTAVASPQRLLLKRPSASAASSAEGMANLDDVIGRIRGAMQQQQEQHPRLQPQGSSAAAENVSGQVAALVSPPVAKAVPTTPSIVRPPHLLVNQERIAAAAAAAARGQQEPIVQSEQKQTKPAGPRAVQNDASRPAPLAPQANRQPSRSPAALIAEPFVTKTEPPIEQAPVWNKFKVSLKPSAAATKKSTAHVSNAQFKAEKARRSLFAQTEPTAPAILTWEPAIPGLSIRTLSRDDQFFPRKYRKGTVITGVVLPSKRLPAAPLAVLSVSGLVGSGESAVPNENPAASGAAKIPVAVKLPGSAKVVSSGASAVVPPVTSSAPSIPTEPASMRAKNQGTAAIGSGLMQDGFVGHSASQSMGGQAPGSFEYLSSSTHPGLDVGSSMLSAASNNRSASQRGRGSGEGVAFAQSLGGGWNTSGLLAGDDAVGARSAGSVSPVSFMVHSELDSSTGKPHSANATAVPGLPDALPSSERFLGSAAAQSLSSGAPSATAPAFHSSKPSISHPSSASTPHTTTHTPLLPPASGLGSATWGHGPLTFLEATPNARGTSLHASTASGDQGRIKDMWARSDGYEYGYGPSAGASGNTGLSIGAGGATHNSLRDIGDDFLPSTLRMSLNDFSDGAAASTPGGGGSASAPNASPNLMRSPAHNRFGTQQQQQQQQRAFPTHLQQHQGGSHQQSASSYGAGSYLDSSAAGTGGGYQSRGRGGHQSAFQYGHQPGTVFNTSLGPLETASSSAALGTSSFDPTVDAFTSSTTKTPYGSWAAPTSSASTHTGGSGAYEGYAGSNSSNAFGRGGPYRSYQPQPTGSNSAASFGNAAATRGGGGVSGQSLGQSHAQASPFASRGPAPHMLLQQQQQRQQQQGEESPHAYGGAGGGGGRLGYAGRGAAAAAGSGAGNGSGHGSGSGPGASGNVDSTSALWQ